MSFRLLSCKDKIPGDGPDDAKKGYRSDQRIVPAVLKCFNRVKCCTGRSSPYCWLGPFVVPPTAGAEVPITLASWWKPLTSMFAWHNKTSIKVHGTQGKATPDNCHCLFSHQHQRALSASSSSSHFEPFFQFHRKTNSTTHIHTRRQRRTQIQTRMDDHPFRTHWHRDR